MEKLPDEILLRIFHLIPAYERKHVLRFVCRHWYLLSFDFTLTEEEIILFSLVWPFTVLRPLLEKNERPSFKFAFVQQIVSFDDFKSFWSTCSPRITWLSFLDSYVPINVLKEILKCCTNLAHLSLTFSSSESSRDFINSFKKVSNEEVSALSVTTLHLRVETFFGENLAPMQPFYGFFSMFPNVTEFELALNSRTMMMVREIVAQIDMLETISNYLDLLGDKLKKLSLFWCDINVPMAARKNITHLLQKIPNIENLTVNGLCVTNYEGGEGRIKTLKSFHNLTSLSLSLIYEEENPTQNLIGKLIKNNDHLRVLKIDGVQLSRMDEETLRTLLNSSLEMLRLHFTSSKTESNRLKNVRHLPVNHSLQGIYLLGDQPIENLCSILFTHVSNLRHLSLTSPNDAILQLVFKHLKGLKSLTLESCHKCTDFGFTGRGINSRFRKNNLFSISELTELKYFHYASVRNRYLGAGMLGQLSLPKLKILKILSPNCEDDTLNLPEIQGLSYFEAMCQAILKSPDIEFIYLHYPPRIPFTVLLRIASNLKHLRCFIFNTEFEVNEEKAEELFNHCPTLRIVGSADPPILHCKNIITQTILGQKYNDRCKIFPELMELLIARWPCSFYPKRLVSFGFEGL